MLNYKMTLIISLNKTKKFISIRNVSKIFILKPDLEAYCRSRSNYLYRYIRVTTGLF